MEDNSSNDDEVQESPISPKMGGKKLKLNDGSSQDSIQETVASSSKDENVDSGVSADKSENTSSDDRAAGTLEGPSNEVVNIGPSGSNFRAILLNVKRQRHTRNYRKRKTPSRDSDSDGSSRDSDDLSAEENVQLLPVQSSTSNYDSGSDDVQEFVNFSSTGSEASNSGSSYFDPNDSYDSDMSPVQEPDTDTDEERSGHWTMPPDDENEEDEEARHAIKKSTAVLQKQRPKHNYNILRELIHRELGVKLYGKATKEDVMFERKFYGSLHVVYRMTRLHNLSKHRGCVNAINFHPEGKLLVSGSDDTSIVLWDWARNKVLNNIKTGHKSNIFQSKFMHLHTTSQLNIVTCARDGQVRLLQGPASGVLSRRRLMAHGRAAHKLHVSPAEPHLVVSAGEDGLVLQADLRAEHACRLFQVKDKNFPIPLYSVHGHPLDKELVVAGHDKFIRVYDRRKSTRPVAMYCPGFFHDLTTPKKKARLSLTHLTCAVYNHNGTEILGSYNDEDIYLFNVKDDAYDKDSTEIKNGYTHRYGGHRNSATFKGVAFFGPNSEYVVSGSDCSYIYIWDKKTESIVQWMKGDVNGVVNCIETHPRFPVIATCGLDRDVKIWMPKAQSDPTYEGIEKTVRGNSACKYRSPLFSDFLPTLYSAWRSENRLFTDEVDVGVGVGVGAAHHLAGTIDFDGNMCTAF